MIYTYIEKFLKGMDVKSDANVSIAEELFAKLEKNRGEDGKVYVNVNQSPALNLLSNKEDWMIPAVPFLNPQQAWVEKNPAAVEAFKEALIGRRVIYSQKPFAPGLPEAGREFMANHADILVAAVKKGGKDEAWARSRAEKGQVVLLMLVTKDGHEFEKVKPKEGAEFKPQEIKDDFKGWMDFTEEVYEKLNKDVSYGKKETAPKKETSKKPPIAKAIKGLDILDAAPAPSAVSAAPASAPTAPAVAPSVAQTAPAAQTAQKMAAKAQAQKQAVIQAVASAPAPSVSAPVSSVSASASSHKVAFSAIFADIAESQKAMAECQRIMAMAMAKALDR